MKQNDYPLLLTVKEISEILGCSERVAYEVMEEKGFPLIRIRRYKRANREDFFEWLNDRKKSVI
jgi:excisionase family DNA binding protein